MPTTYSNLNWCYATGYTIVVNKSMSDTGFYNNKSGVLFDGGISIMSELRTNRIIPRDGLPSGSSGGIIQVKSVTKTDPFDTLSTSYTDVTGLAVSITPTRADSKILVMYMLMHVWKT